MPVIAMESNSVTDKQQIISAEAEDQGTSPVDTDQSGVSNSLFEIEISPRGLKKC